MKIRSSDGRIVGKLGDYSTYGEDQWYKNEKVKHGDLIFPRHKESLHGECVTYHISQLNEQNKR